MIVILHLLRMFIVDLFKPRWRLQAENLLLRHQLGIASRRAPPRFRLHNSDRACSQRPFCGGTVRAFAGIGDGNPERRPRIAQEIRDLIRRMSLENPLWGATKIHGELLKLGFEVAKSTVSIYMAPRRDRPLQTWKTFIRNHAEEIASIDLFVVPTIAFGQLFAFLVLGHERRRLVWFAVTHNPTAEWLGRQITKAFPWETAPKYLVRDKDRAFGAAFRARVRAMGIRDRPTSFRSPWQNGHVERLIGSIRRECTDHLIVFNAEHLRRTLARYAVYYNEARTHISLGKDAPSRRPIEHFGDIIAQPILGGLHHRYALTWLLTPTRARGAPPREGSSRGGARSEVFFFQQCLLHRPEPVEIMALRVPARRTR
jgi:transposase InsO family protein